MWNVKFEIKRVDLSQRSVDVRVAFLEDEFGTTLRRIGRQGEFVRYRYDYLNGQFKNGFEFSAEERNLNWPAGTYEYDVNACAGMAQSDLVQGGSDEEIAKSLCKLLKSVRSGLESFPNTQSELKYRPDKLKRTRFIVSLWKGWGNISSYFSDFCSEETL